MSLGVLLALAYQATPARAEVINFRSTLDAAQAISTCPGGSPATGSGTMTYDTDTNLLTWNIMFSNLSGAVTVAHFHGPAAPLVDAGIQVTITDITSPSVGSMTITETQETQLRNELWYTNYHTAMCGGGEIRGQVLFAPVGGIAEPPDAAASPLKAGANSDGNSWLIASLAAAAGVAVVVFGGSVWYAKGRSRD
ncbi:MAG: CHRD domain-containing protein [Dehalococcoidia bacterium]